MLYYGRSVGDGGVLAGVTGEARRLAVRRDLEWLSQRVPADRPAGRPVLAGVDAHKDTLAVAVIDPAGRPVVVTELANAEAGFDAREQLLAEHSVSRVGVMASVGGR